MIESQNLPRRIYGVDFSGAKDAGKKIWIARGIIEDKKLLIEGCNQASSFLGIGESRDSCLAAFRDFIAKEKNCAFGLDFPFGLPRKLIRESSWEKFVLSFRTNYSDPDKFKRECLEITEQKEQKRATDEINETPFSPYNLWLYKQTYFGIHDILHPLVSADQARILPMQKASSDKPWLIEICPASTLAKMGLYDDPYKGKTENHYRAREHILKTIERKGVSIPENGLRMKILKNRGGDALDSIVAVYATFRAYCSNFIMTDKNENYSIEGYVYA